MIIILLELFPGKCIPPLYSDNIQILMYPVFKIEQREFQLFKHIIILKIGKLKSVGGGRSTVNAERINSQLSLLHEKAITSVDPGGVDRQSMQRGSTVSFHFCMKRQSLLLILGGLIDSQCREDQQSTFTFT